VADDETEALDEAQVLTVVRDLWKRHQDELPDLERARGYARGRLGKPEVPEGVNEELREIAKLSVINVIRLVEDAFASGLTVEGFRSPEETQDAPAWALWQRHKLDARQSEIHRPTIRYGSAYAIYVGKKLALRSPRQVFAVYEDPTVDEWPVYALETWIDRSEARPVRRGRLIDSTHVYSLNLGPVVKARPNKDNEPRTPIKPEQDAEPEPHGFDHTPVVRFVNKRDDEELVVGEVEPLIVDQRAINTVNFDRLVVSRFGAFKQKYAIGWAPATAEELAKSSVARLMSFADENVKVGTFDASDPDSYTKLLQDMKAQVALSAQVPIVTVLGSLTNVGAETVAIADGSYSRKLKDKRGSLGESWEQLLRLMGADEEIKVDDAAEVVWVNTDARSFQAVVDGISKLVAAGVPIEVLVDEIPGWTKQRADQARAAIRRQAGRAVTQVIAAAGSAVGEAGDGASNVG
jgi:hypothetical protein